MNSVGRRTLGTVAALMLTSGCAASAATPTDLPLETRIPNRVEAWAERADVPATLAVVEREGADTITVAHGRADESQPLTPRTQFRIASITKLFVATLVMDLVENGELDLDMAVDELVDLPSAPRVSVRQLLAHTSGIPDYGSPEFFQTLVDEPDRHWEAADVLATVSDVRPSFAPGTEHEYSNTNYVVLGELVEAVTGRPWHEELRTRILEPLHLEDTYVAGLEPPHGDGLVAAAYFDIDNDGNVEDIEDGPWPALETSEGAAGAMISTAGDVTAFTSALFSGRILSPRTLELMGAPSQFAGRYDDYGLGVELHRPDLRTPVRGHGGFLPGYRCVTWYVPSEHATITVMVNHSQGDSADIATLLLAELQRRTG
jgi:D-alanyl-D-alanine carboxypeptidase